MLFFKARFLPLIRSGRKRQTIRLWSHARVKAGRRAFVPGLGYVAITRIDILQSLAALTRADALADGFASRREMLAEIRRLYPAPRAGREVFRIQFRWPAARTVARPLAAPVAIGTISRNMPASLAQPRRSARRAADRRILLKDFVLRLGRHVRMMP